MKFFSLLGLVVTMLLLSGCGNYLHKLTVEMKKMQQEKALAATEDIDVVQTFIKELPNSTVSQNQVFTNKKLDLGKRTTNSSDWVYRPVEFFERNANEETPAYKTWTSVVKKRGGVVKKYNAKVATKISGFVYLNKLYPYQRYFYSLAPTYVEYDNHGNMISAFMKVLKTEDVSSAGGLVVQGRRLYNAYEHDIVVLRTSLRKLQMNTSRSFFEDNLLDSNVVLKNQSNITPTKETKTVAQNNTQAPVNINQMMIDKFNAQNNTNYKNMVEIQKHIMKIQ